MQRAVSRMGDAVAKPVPEPDISPLVRGLRAQPGAQ
jgi:hypothetical protein